MKNRTVVTNPTNAQLEAQAVCRVLDMVKCPSVEWQRYKIMQLWAQEFSRLKFTGSSLSAYFDKLVKAALAYKSPADQFRIASLFLSGIDIYTQVFEQSYMSYLMDQAEWSLVAFNSSKLKIECLLEKMPSHDDYTTFKWVKITFLLPKGSSPSSLSLNVSLSSIRDYQNGYRSDFKNT